MPRRQLHGNEVEAFEKGIDAFVGAVRPPVLNQSIGFLALFSVSEQLARAVAGLGVDHLKNSLKSACAEIRRQLPEGPLPILKIAVDEGEEVAASTFVEAHQRYLAAIGAFQSYWFGHASAEMDDDSPARIAFKRRPEFVAHEALDIILSVDIPAPSVLDAALNARNGIPLFDERVGGYVFDVAAGRRVLQAQPAFPKLFPAGWTSPDGTAEHLRAALLGLAARCSYHMLATREADLLESAFVTSEQELARQVSQIAEVELAVVEKVVRRLRYGAGTRTPDPALQPFVSVGGTRLVTAPFLVVSSNLERNYLALLARTERTAFDATSELFEVQMTGELLPALSARSWLTRSNFNAPAAGETDVLVLDRTRRFALVLELQWTIPAADPAEVNDRLSAAEKKRKQCDTKLSSIRNNLAAVLQPAGIPAAEATGWTVEGVVVIDGATGGPRLTPDYPHIVTVHRRVFEAAIRAPRSLRDAFDWMRLERWLPVAPKHFRWKDVDHVYGAQTISWVVLHTFTSAKKLLG